MGIQRIPGLSKRGGVWHIDKVFRGTRICESTGTSDLREAQDCLTKRMSQIREAKLHGIRAARTFRCAATKYLQDNAHKKSIEDDASHLKFLDRFIGSLELKEVHMGSLQSFIAQRRQEGRKTKSINLALGTVRHILNLAADEWMDERGMTWLEKAPKIKLLPVTDSRSPYPLAWEEQALLFHELPDHLACMALFKVNTGTREQEVCTLRWQDEVKVPELETSVFIIPGSRVKNGDDRLVVLNRVACSVIEAQRGRHPDYVFAHPRAKDSMCIPVTKMYNTAWRSARERAADEWGKRHEQPAPDGFRNVRVHDLKHTYGRRLRAAGVSFEDRQDLLGHRSGRITTHYSRAELTNLIEASEKVCETESRKSHATFWLRRTAS